MSAGRSRDLADGVTNINVSHIWTPVESIDFSSHHNVLIRNSDGTTVPMDEPWIESKQIAPRTWQIRNDGDYCYLLAGDTMAVMIDCGYGAGNIRKEAESIAGKPVKYVINTHYHFDHTANDAYFDAAFMAPITADYAALPYASFKGINFPRNYPVITVKDGYKINLGNRELTIITIPHPNHAQGAIAILDPTSRILFTGDEFLFDNKIVLNITLPEFAGNMEHLEKVRSSFDTLYGGPEKRMGPFSTGIMKRPSMASCRILPVNHQRLPAMAPKRRPQMRRVRLSMTAAPYGRGIVQPLIRKKRFPETGRPTPGMASP